MLEKDFPPRKDHLATAKMLDIYEVSALATVDLIKSYGNSKPGQDERRSLEIKFRLNLAKAWYEEVKKIRKEYYKQLKGVAYLYNDDELLIFTYGIIKKDDIEVISKKTNIPVETVKTVLERIEADMELISLIE
jgi:hypothetical protein